MANVAVSRTLVKSPPEVWAELEREGRLAELLADDSLEVTVAEELAVLEWRAQNACGRIEIKTSGWGTKVSLTAEIDEPASQAEPAAAETASETVAQDEPVVTDEADPAEMDQAEVETDAAPEPQTEATAETADETQQDTPKPGFWARIKSVFEGNSELADPLVADTTEQTEVPETVPAPEPELEVEIEVTTEDAPASVVATTQAPAAEAAAGVDYEQLLTGVLDHLGSAHKRPFSSM